MRKNWKLKPEIPSEILEKLLLHPPLVRQLLYNRGLVEKGQIDDFLNPQYEKLPSPFLFQNMQKAVDRIWQAIEQNEQICIYGDYDADAVTANAVLQQTFRYLGVAVGSYIPDRFTEGYGINLDALSKIKDQGCKLIITVDCGTNSVEAAEFCRKHNIDLIITDHHEIISEVPKAYALINPKNPGDGYPYPEITGVGVAFKLACGILSKFEKVTAMLSSRNFLPNSSSGAAKNIRDPDKSQVLDSGYSPSANSGMTERVYAGGFEKWLLDLVAIGTVADCHSLLGENRLLVNFGLKVLPKSKWAGLRALIRSAALDFLTRAPDTYTLGFIVAPRLNAAGRLEHANIALHLLMEKDPVASQEKAFALEQINQRRQQLTQQVLSEARAEAEILQGRKFLVVAGKDWPKGVVGLAAGKLAEEFHKPVIVLSQEGGVLTGSARTAGEFNVIQALKYAQEHLLKFGGHRQAAGLTLQTSALENFYGKLLEFAEKNLTLEDLNGKLELEAEIKEDQISLDTLTQLAAFEPFGTHNPRPKFLITDLKILGLKAVGQQKQHVQVFLQKGQKKISAIAFAQPHIEKSFKIGDTIDVAAELIEDGWNGRKDVKLRIIDLRKTL